MPFERCSTVYKIDYSPVVAGNQMADPTVRC